jgi:hypothetical protein
MNCCWQGVEMEESCGKPSTHFVVVNGNFYPACMYHYCLYYGIEIKDEIRIMKEVRSGQH